MRIYMAMIKIGSVVMICILASVNSAITFAQEESALVAQAEDLVYELERSDFDSTPVDEWARNIRELVEIGGPAVEPICEALRSTDGNFQMRAYAFALRAINDPRAVPTLIETIPKTLLPLAMEDMDKGFKVEDRELMKFMLANDVYRSRAGRFRFARPSREVNEALYRITAHKIDEQGLNAMYPGHGAAQIRMKRSLYRQHAERWKNWWEQHARSTGVSLEYRAVDLQEIDLKELESVDPFESGNAIATLVDGNIIVESFDVASYVCFYDLDTSRTGKLPEDFSGDNFNIDEVIDWARDHRFDVMGVRTELDGKPGANYALLPIDMEVWQNPGGRFESIDEEVQQDKIELGTPVDGYLTWFDSESATYDPERKAAFLFRTADGTCGAILVVSQVTRIWNHRKDGSVNANELPDNAGWAKGVKFHVKIIHEP